MPRKENSFNQKRIKTNRKEKFPRQEQSSWVEKCNGEKKNIKNVNKLPVKRTNACTIECEVKKNETFLF